MAATLDEYLAEIECYPTWEKRRWYQRLWDAAIKSVVVVPSASTNMPSVPCDRKECPAWDCGVCSSYLGSSCKVNGTAHVG